MRVNEYYTSYSSKKNLNIITSNNWFWKT